MLYKYRLYTREGDEASEAEYAVTIKPGETIWIADGRKVRLVDVVPTEDVSDEYMGLLMIEYNVVNDEVRMFASSYSIRPERRTLMTREQDFLKFLQNMRMRPAVLELVIPSRSSAFSRGATTSPC